MRGWLLLLLLLMPVAGWAEEDPRPPCGAPPVPAYARVGSLPAVRVWAGDELGDGWAPPACTGWEALPFRTLVATAGRFHHQGTVEDLLARFAAVSTLTRIRYWSVSDGRWQPLVTGASALKGPDAAARRPDFTAAELRDGGEHHFAQNDNRSTGDVVYRLQVRALDPDRLVVATMNAGPVRYLLLPLAGPGDLQALYFLERQSAEVWGYYALARTGTGASPLTAGHTASYVNRAVAYFRHLAGLPTDQAPPAAP